MDCKTITRSVSKIDLKFVRPVNGRLPKYGHIYNILVILHYEPATKTQIKKLLPYANYSSKTIKFIEQRGLVENKNGLLIVTESGQAAFKHLNFVLEKQTS